MKMTGKKKHSGYKQNTLAPGRKSWLKKIEASLANAVEVLLLSYRDRRHRQPVSSTSKFALPPLHFLAGAFVIFFRFCQSFTSRFPFSFPFPFSFNLALKIALFCVNPTIYDFFQAVHNGNRDGSPEQSGWASGPG